MSNIDKYNQFDAHIGITPSGSIHIRPYLSLLCSNCASQSIDFKINMEQYQKMKILVEKLKEIEHE